MTTKTVTIPPISRRGFMKGASLGASGAVLGSLLVACGSQTTDTVAGASDHLSRRPRPPSPGAMTADEMDTMHENGVKAFVAGVKTEGQGNQPLVCRVSRTA